MIADMLCFKAFLEDKSYADVADDLIKSEVKDARTILRLQFQLRETLEDIKEAIPLEACGGFRE